MEPIDNSDVYLDGMAYISHEPATTTIDNPVLAAHDRATEEARKLLFPKDAVPIAGDFAACLENAHKTFNMGSSYSTHDVAAAEAAVEEARKLMKVAEQPPAVVAAEAAVEEARTVMGAPKVEAKTLTPLNADAVAETIAPYSEFKTNSISESICEYTIHVKESQDAHGRQFYEFDNGRSKPLLACVFSTAAGELISLNGIVMPLGSFQSIVYARTAPAKLPKEVRRTASRAGGDLRAAIPVGDDKVLCTLMDGQQISVPNTTVQHVMMALQRLAPPAVRVATEADPAEEHVGPLRRLWRWLY